MTAEFRAVLPTTPADLAAHLRKASKNGASMQERTSPDWPNGEDLSSRGAILPADVEAQLKRILGSCIFRNAPRHSRFLSFVVSKALAGRGDDVKEYLIGLEVFDRKPDFDPSIDPVVRSEARRLRFRLAD